MQGSPIQLENQLCDFRSNGEHNKHPLMWSPEWTWICV